MKNQTKFGKISDSKSQHLTNTEVDYEKSFNVFRFTGGVDLPIGV
jgi:hypothetical protein